MHLKFPLDQVCFCISYVLLQENKYFGDTKIPAVKCRLLSVQERPWNLVSIGFLLFWVFFFNVCNEKIEVYDFSSVFLLVCVYIVCVDLVKI